ncbi:hypothetical protein [Micromonospora cremea]|uniref:hypothetical protein n=1 Tax=Micromonospora cremea TaxID=709881 RepID=UPI0013563F2C|nr:hypothetical protein [Micromonospora cremea]
MILTGVTLLIGGIAVRTMIAVVRRQYLAPPVAQPVDSAHAADPARAPARAA